MTYDNDSQQHSFTDHVSVPADDSRPYFTIQSYAAGEKMERQSVGDSQIVFIISGRIKSVSLRSVIREFSSGSALLFPKFCCVFGKAIEDCEMVVCRIPEDADHYDRFSKLRKYLSIPSDFRYDYKSLMVCPILSDFLHLLKTELSSGMDSAVFQRLKLEELGLCFQTQYSYDVLAEFFYPLVGHQFLSFRKYVLDNYKYHEDVSSFAEAAGMSLSTFSRSFKAAFGSTVYKWLDDRKAEHVFREIVMTDLTFSEIADRFGFSSQAYLVYYTKKHFGLAPSAIRKSFDWGE